MDMTQIKLDTVSLKIPLLHGMYQRSLRAALVQGITGGKIENHAVSALTNISLELKEGDRCALLGHNGAGKTSLLRLLAGIYRPTSGSCYMHGEKRALLNLYSGVRDELSGRENCELFLRTRLNIKDKQKRELLMQEIQELSGLGEFFHIPVRSYSQGMRYRLLFSTATIRSPQILLMDEILGFSDKEFREKFYRRTMQFYEATDIIVLATQNMEFVEDMCNIIVHMQKGEIKEIVRSQSN